MNGNWAIPVLASILILGLIGMSEDAHAASIIFTTDTTITSNTIIATGETWTINLGVTLTINSGVTISNFGTIDNSGFINNFGTIRSFDTINNSGTIENDGIIKNDLGDFNNENNGIINNNRNGSDELAFIENTGTFRNFGFIDNDGTIRNDFRSILDPCGRIVNRGTIDNSDIFGTIINLCLIDNCGIIIGEIPGGRVFSSCSLCGDGDVNLSEECDDGNPINDDACSNVCTENICDNERIDPGETCDDGARVNEDGCSATCQTEAGFECTGEPSICTLLCGNSIVDPGEDCDDGNTVPADGCSATCQTEAGFTCTGQPSVCTTTCGDGIRVGTEQCDDGNSINTDACLDTCQSASCGDSFVQAGVEECDPPSAGICDLNCLFVTSSSGTVVGFTEVPRFCGLKQMAVVDSPVPPGDFAEVSQPIIFAETVDLQVSNEQTLRVANTGGGDAVVNADLTLLDTDGETTDWEDLLGATFDRSNTRSHHLSGQPYSSMTPIIDNPFIDVLLGQTAPESTFVDRFLKVRPNAGDAAFSAAGRDLLTFTQVLRLEVSCDPAASCPDAFPILDNGECVLD